MKQGNVLQDKISRRLAENNLRVLTTSLPGIDFISNDYLGLARSQKMAGKISEYISKIPYRKNGSTGSRLLSGNFEELEKLEERIADFFYVEAALFLPTGYQANLALISALGGKDDTLIYDELSHASIKDGARLSLARKYSFRHNDSDDLKRKLSQSSGNKYVIVESIYSMDGDHANLISILNITEENEAFLIVDEAHSTGLTEKNGAGMCVEMDIANRIFARIHTFGKAAGVHGGAICGSNLLRDYIINFSRPFIYSTGPSLHQVISVQASLDELENADDARAALNDRITFFHDEIKKMNSKLQFLKSNSPIQAIIIPGNDEVKRIAGKILEQGFQVKPILAPTVKRGTERIRICLHSFNSEEEIRKLISVVSG
jgi:8-amino-7-oxononanoate synthase